MKKIKLSSLGTKNSAHQTKLLGSESGRLAWTNQMIHQKLGEPNKGKIRTNFVIGVTDSTFGLFRITVYNHILYSSSPNLIIAQFWLHSNGVDLIRNNAAGLNSNAGNNTAVYVDNDNHVCIEVEVGLDNSRLFVEDLSIQKRGFEIV